MASELLRELLQATLATSAVIALLQLLRRPLRRRFGARLAYSAWVLVPLAMLAVWLPAAPPVVAPAAGGVLVQLGQAAWEQQAQRAIPSDGTLAFLIAWAIGCAGTLLYFVARQRHFERRMSRASGRAFDTVAGHGPAVVGWWRSRIVLPVDFRERYTRGERRLVLAHEAAHLRAGDIHAQAFATALRCLFWFNPLVHLAAAQFRFDQELACDAAVLGRFPRGRARYGRAMLKTQLAGFGLPVGCHWQSSHPLKERIEMLKQPLPARTRKIAGTTCVALLVAGASYAAWAAQPARPAPATPTAASQPAPVRTLVKIGPMDKLSPPVYPNTKLEGKVDIELLVAANGTVKDVKVIKAEPQGVFEQVTIDAARQWHVTPATENGKPIESRVRTQVVFTLDGDPDKKS
jgi:TonB family protein